MVADMCAREGLEQENTEALTLNQPVNVYIKQSTWQYDLGQWRAPTE